MEDIQDIKKRIDIVSFAESLGVEVMPNRKNARCFNKQVHKHGDQNPSLAFTKTKNGEGYFKCFACGISGSIVDLYALVKGLEVGEAIKEIKRQHGNMNTVTNPKRNTGQVENLKNNSSLEGQFSDTIKKATKEVKETYKKLYQVCTEEGLSDTVKQYLTGDNRGLTEETIKKFKLFSISNTDRIVKRLNEVCSQEELLNAGLFANGSRGNYFKFSGYPVVIPYLEDGEIVYIKARRLDGKPPKYMQVGGLSIPLFNRDILKTFDRTQPLYVCEGEFDAMITAQNGFNAVGVIGVNGLKQEIIEDLVGLKVYLAFDNDEAGQTAIKQVAQRLIGMGVVVLGQADLPNGVKDLTEYFTKSI
jgi:DNA primase